MKNTRVLLSSDVPHVGVPSMPTLKIHYSERDTLPDLLEKRAGELDITVEQLVKRFISEGIRDQMDNGPLIPGESIDDFFVNNGVLKPK